MTQLSRNPKQLAAARRYAIPAKPLPQTRPEVELAFSLLAERRALLASRTAQLDRDRASIEAVYAADIAPIEKEIARLETEIQAWCEARRDELTRNGKTKTVKFANGEVSWKLGKAKVVLTAKEEDIIAALKRLKLGKAFVRVSEAIDKVAVLTHPEKVARVPGLSVAPGTETFGIVARAPVKERV